jgi:hypothetical protein
MPYLDQHAVAENADFRKKIAIAVATAAKTIAGEAVGTSSPTEYQKRQALARRVMASMESAVPIFARLVATNSTIGGTTSDAALQTEVNNLWNKVAGIDVND